MRTLDRRSTATALGAMLTAVSAFGAEVIVVPVGATGPHAIIENQLIATTPGPRIWLEVHLRDWDLTHEGRIVLKVWQVTFDEADFRSGVLGALRLADESCGVDADCDAAFGVGSKCGPEPLPQNLCAAGFQDTTRQDWVHDCCFAVGAVKLESPFISFGSVSLDGYGAEDIGETLYGGTLVLDAHPYARGTFIIAPISNPKATFMFDTSNQPIPIDRVVPAFLTLAPNDACCRSDGSCSNTAAISCASLGRTPILGTLCLNVDADGNGIDDACDGDCNDNRAWDAVDLELGQSLDCNKNDVPDECDLNAGVSNDCNANDLPDECETLPSGDLTGDGVIRKDDVTELDLCLTAPCPHTGCAGARYPKPCCITGDFDRDGDVDLWDVAQFQLHFQGQGE